MALQWPPLRNGLQKTLDAQLDQGTTASMTLNNVTGVQNKPGVVVINRIDTNGAEKSASLREYVLFTGTSGNTLTGLTRGLSSSTDQDHAVGSVVEFIFDVTTAQAIIDALLETVDADGALDTTKVVDLTTAQTLTNKTLTAPQIGGDADLDDATGNVTVQGADPYRTITLPAKAWSPTTTSGCADSAKVEAATNDIDYDVLDFDASSDESAYINFPMPNSYDGGVIQFRFIWTAAGGSAAQTVVFELSGRSFADDDAIDQAVGTPVEVSDALIATGDVHISSWSSDVTITGAGANELLHLELMRDVSEDNLSVDARLIAVQIRYKQSQFSD